MHGVRKDELGVDMFAKIKNGNFVVTIIKQSG